LNPEALNGYLHHGKTRNITDFRTGRSFAPIGMMASGSKRKQRLRLGENIAIVE
jgi:hypothetical protein